MDDPTDKTDFWRFLGIGAMIFLISLGMGSCMFLGSLTSITIPAG